MQFSYAAVIAVVATVAYSQSVADLVGQFPSCALTCLATAAAAAGCGISDYACQCGPAKDSIISSATPCVTTGCTGDEALKVLGISNQICDAIGGSASSATGKAPATTADSSPASSFASVIPTAAPTKTTTAPPIQITGAGSKARVGAAVAGAAVFAALVL